MNHNYILFNLREATEELERTIREIEANPDYDVGEMTVAFSHLYHHINTAWNARNASQEEAEECSEDNFRAWRAFPSAEELLLD